MNERPSYYAIIPADVRYDKDLKDKAKLLYGEITALSNKDGYCYASNKYFADLYGVSTRTITDLIKELVLKNYILNQIIYEDGTKKVIQRRLYLLNKTSIPIEENFDTPIEENFQDNNTSINNTSNNKKEIYKERFIKPTIEEIEEYCKERNNGIDAVLFYNFYESKNWYVGKTKMVNWKNCIITWERNRKQNVKQDNGTLPEWFDKELDFKPLDNENLEELKDFFK